MSDKPVAGFVTTLVVAPMMILCCLGPVLYVTFAAGFFSWLGGINPMRIALIVTIVAGGGFLLVQWIKKHRAAAARTKENLQ